MCLAMSQFGMSQFEEIQGSREEIPRELAACKTLASETKEIHCQYQSQGEFPPRRHSQRTALAPQYRALSPRLRARRGGFLTGITGFWHRDVGHVPGHKHEGVVYGL